jgi:tetratricopeptide (TPR) repeat protein
VIAPRLTRAVAFLGAFAALAACARSLEQIRWDETYAAATGDLDKLIAASRTAHRPIDRASARFDIARLEVKEGRPASALSWLLRIAAEAERREDRARARHEVARLLEDLGRRDQAIAVHRALVETYPELMPGERALFHLLRLAREDGPEAVLAHLRYTHELYPRLRHTRLGDNLLFQAAEVVHRRWLDARRDADWRLAVALHERVLRDHPLGELRDDALWELSWLFHDRGLFDREIAAIETIQRGRELVSFFGQDEHPYFYVGQRRLARLFLVHLHDPRRASLAWRRYADTWTRSIKRDDAWFFAGCAALQAGMADAAEEDFAAIAEHRPESRFLRRLDLARQDPTGPHCVPPEETR